MCLGALLGGAGIGLFSWNFVIVGAIALVFESVLRRWGRVTALRIRAEDLPVRTRGSLHENMSKYLGCLMRVNVDDEPSDHETQT